MTTRPRTRLLNANYFLFSQRRRVLMRTALEIGRVLVRTALERRGFLARTALERRGVLARTAL
jgi:hypothetical protein